MGQRYEPAAGRSRHGRLALWPMSPATRLSDQDMNAALSDDLARSRPRPGLGIAERCAPRSQGAEAKARVATLTIAQRAFAGAELRTVELSNLEDLEAKTRGLWWGCGGWTTRSFSNALNALSPTLWPCGKKQVERFFSNL